MRVYQFRHTGMGRYLYLRPPRSGKMKIGGLASTSKIGQLLPVATVRRARVAMHQALP